MKWSVINQLFIFTQREKQLKQSAISLKALERFNVDRQISGVDILLVIFLRNADSAVARVLGFGH
jgi:hypothetical protein